MLWEGESRLLRAKRGTFATIPKMGKESGSFKKIKGSVCDCGAGSEREHGKGDFESYTAFLRASTY